MQTQINDAGVNGINGLLELNLQGIADVKVPSFAQKAFGQGGENAPVARVISVSQRAAAHWSVQAKMVELRAARVQTRFDVAQAFAPRQLRKDHADKLIPTGELADFVIAAEAGDATLELLRVDRLKKLSQNEFAGVHRSRLRRNKPCELQIAHTAKRLRERFPIAARVTSTFAMTGHLWLYRRLPVCMPLSRIVKFQSPKSYGPHQTRTRPMART